ncbi:hypothetical protein DSECCO2_634210 [anaerobic digester metagenome]
MFWENHYTKVQAATLWHRLGGVIQGVDQGFFKADWLDLRVYARKSIVFDQIYVFRQTNLLQCMLHVGNHIDQFQIVILKLCKALKSVSEDPDLFDLAAHDLQIFPATLIHTLFDGIQGQQHVGDVTTYVMG